LKKLETLYMTKSLTNQLYMKYWFHTLWKKNDMIIKDHLDEFNWVILDLQNITVKVGFKDKALILLCLLPPSYNLFVDNFFYKNNSLNSKVVKASINSNELKVSVRES
jgi:hypothetical protein